MPDSIPMPWLGRPADTSGLSNTVGGLIGGVARAGRASRRNNTSFGSELPQGLEQGQNLARDPMYYLKRARLNTEIVRIGAQYNNAVRGAELQARTIANEEADQSFLADVTSQHAGNPEALLESMQSFIPKSSRGVQAATSIRMAATQGLQRNLSQKMNGEFVRALSKLTNPTLITELMTDAYDANGLVKPEKLSTALTEANRAKIETFAPTKEEKLLNAYRRSLDEGDVEAADYYKSRMTTADDRMRQTLLTDLEKRYARKDVELQGLRAAVAELERNPRAKVMMTEEATLLARRRSQLAAAEEELKALERHRDGFNLPAPAATPAVEPVKPNKDPLGLFP